MFTRCPACQTVFRVHAEMLRIAQGQVRCGRCSAQFNALDSLAEDPEALVMPTDTGVPPQSEPLPERPAAEASVAEPAGQTAVAEESAAAEIPVVSHENGLPASAVLAPEVIQAALLIEEPAARPLVPRLVGGATILVLLLVLAGQWLYLQRAPLYERPAWRPVLERACAVLGCALPLLHQPEHIEVVERTVREHPRVAGALLVDCTFVSRADRAIAYPVLEMRLSDVSGNRVAGRRFTPAEYLSSGVDGRVGLHPGQPVRVLLELVEPPFDAASFQFEFF